MNKSSADDVELVTELRALREGAPPRGLAEFREWCSSCVRSLRKANAIDVEDSSFGPIWTEAARLVKAAGHYSLGLSDLASPEEAQEPFHQCVHRDTKSPRDAIQRFLECLKWARHALPAPPEEPIQTNGRQLRRPPDRAFAAYRLWVFQGLTQTRIADMLTREFRRNVSQGQVSRWRRQVDEWIRAGNVLPDLAGFTSARPSTVDPSVLEMGERRDGRTPRQRQRRDSSD